MEFSDEELAAAQAAAIKDNTTDPPAVEPPAKADPPPADNIDKADPPANSSLTDAEKETARLASEASAAAAKNEPPPAAKTFEEELAERFDGKFKTIDELKAIVNAPKEELDDDIKHFQALKKSGVKLDEEFFKLQSLNVDAMTDPEEILLETMRRSPEYQGVSDRTLRSLINKKYGINNWVNKLVDEGEESLTEDELADKEIMERDALNGLDALKKLKQERAFINPANEEKRKADEDNFKLRVADFEKFVDDKLVSGVTSLNTEIQIDKDTKENYEYKISETVRNDVGNVMKLAAVDLSVLVNQFAEKDAEGKVNINNRRVYEMLVKSKTYDEAVANAFKDGMAQGQKGFVKNDLKNASFKAGDSQVGSTIAQTEEEAIALAMKASGKKMN